MLRDGKLLWSRTGDDIRSDDLVEALLAGQEQRRHRAETASAPLSGTPALSLSGLTDREGAFTDVSFDVAPGEIVAIGGVGGSGKYSVGEAIAGYLEAFRLAQASARQIDSVTSQIERVERLLKRASDPSRSRI